MELEDLKPYFELYNNLKTAGKDTILNFELGKKEREYAGKEIRLEGIVSEIDLEKNELILTCRIGGNDDSIHIISSSHFFIFASAPQLGTLLASGNVELNDLVKIEGTINTLHRNSVIRLTLNTISVVQKKYRQNKSSKKPGCFVATAVYGSEMAPSVIEFYRIRDARLATFHVAWPGFHQCLLFFVTRLCEVDQQQAPYQTFYPLLFTGSNPVRHYRKPGIISDYLSVTSQIDCYRHVAGIFFAAKPAIRRFPAGG